MSKDKDKNKLTPGANLLWEGSRMILPEHKAAILDFNERAKLKQKPILDEQRIEELSRAVAESMFGDAIVTVVVFGERENDAITGKIEKIDKELGRIKITNENEYSWVPFSDIISVTKSKEEV